MPMRSRLANNGLHQTGRGGVALAFVGGRSLRRALQVKPGVIQGARRATERSSKCRLRGDRW